MNFWDRTGFIIEIGGTIGGTVTCFVNPDSRKIGGKFPQANNLRRFGLQKPAGLGLGHNR